MDGAEKLIEKIMEDARMQAMQNIEQAEKEADSVIKSAKEEALRKRGSIIEKTEKEVSEKKKRLIAVAELEGRKIKLKAKQEVIAEAFLKAHEKLNLLPQEQYKSMLADMIINMVPEGNEEVIVSKEDKQRLGNDFINLVNKRLKNMKKQGNIKFSEECRNIGGGFILKSGNIETNNSFDTIFRMKYNDIESEIIRILFN
ncbi:MAG TPA: V-type ATP synthase subunit E family protein [Clostridiales bacterium]|nr:V-type ATP synthase subunit E family protein [Clostridiales bacterium]